MLSECTNFSYVFTFGFEMVECGSCQYTNCFVIDIPLISLTYIGIIYQKQFQFRAID